MEKVAYPPPETENELGYISINLMKKQQEALSEWQKTNAFEYRELKDIPTSTTFNFSKDSTLTVSFSKKNSETNDMPSVYCTLKTAATANKKDSTLFLKLNEVDEIFRLCSLSRVSFMSVEHPEEHIIRDGTSSRIMLTLSKVKNEYSKRKVDIRYFYLSKQKKWLPTRIGITLYGFNEIHQLSTLQNDVAAIITTYSAMNDMFEYFKRDLYARFCYYNTNLPANECLREGTFYAHSYIARCVVSFIFDGMLQYYTEEFVKYIAMMLQLPVIFPIADTLEYISDAVVQDVCKKYDSVFVPPGVMGQDVFDI